MYRINPIAVFLGPTLSHAEARDILEAEYYPPAGMGDIYRAMADGVQTILLIDGVFHQAPSVWHRELLDAMAEGITLIGASSMGALRAAELYPFGMLGHGQVFAWYRDGKIEGDDEVALVHGTQDEGFLPISEPLVNIRYTLQQGVRDGALTHADARELAAYAQGLYYPQRSFDALLDSPLARAWTRDRRDALAQYLCAHRVDLKRQDAISALRYCQQQTATSGAGRPATPPPAPSITRMKWELVPALYGQLLTPQGRISGDELLQHARMDERLVSTLRETLTRRCFLLEWARQNAITCPQAHLRAFTELWEREHGVDPQGNWLRANGLLQGTYHRLLAELALADWITQQGPASFISQPEALAEWDDADDSCFILEWARQNGVSCPPDWLVAYAQSRQETGQAGPAGAIADAALVAWIIEQGPEYFGIVWSLDVALVRELQITGIAAQMAAYIASRAAGARNADGIAAPATINEREQAHV